MKARTLSALQRDLKPCPFCAGPAALEPVPHSINWWRVRCKSYHCGATTWAVNDAEDAARVWNRRDGEA